MPCLVFVRKWSWLVYAQGQQTSLLFCTIRNIPLVVQSLYLVFHYLPILENEFATYKTSFIIQPFFSTLERERGHFTQCIIVFSNGLFYTSTFLGYSIKMQQHSDQLVHHFSMRLFIYLESFLCVRPKCSYKKQAFWYFPRGALVTNKLFASK